MSSRTQAHVLLIGGTSLFVLGLLNGYVIQLMAIPRIGLSAHLAGVQNALVLWAFGLMWPHVGLHGQREKFTVWLAIYGMYAIWLGLFLAAAWGASRAMPIAGAGSHSLSSNGQELVSGFLAVSGSVA